MKHSVTIQIQPIGFVHGSTYIASAGSQEREERYATNGTLVVAQGCVTYMEGT